MKLDKKDEIHKIEQRKSIVDKNFSAVRSIAITYAGVAWYTNIKDILEKREISGENISFLTITINTIIKYEDKEYWKDYKKLNTSKIWIEK